MQCSLLDINLLKDESIGLLIKVLERRPVPLLVLLGSVAFETIDVLTQLLQHLLFELTLGLARAKVGSLDLESWGGTNVELSAFGGWRHADNLRIAMLVRRVREDPLRWTLHLYRHGGDVYVKCKAKAACREDHTLGKVTRGNALPQSTDIARRCCPHRTANHELNP